MSDKYTLIAAEYAANIAAPAADAPTLTKMCLWIGVSKSGFYDWKDRPLSATAVRQEYLKGKIEEVFDDNDQTYGYRRVHAELARQGEQATSELVRRLMRDLGLVPCQVRKPRSLTTQATDIAKIPDRVRRDFTAAAPYLKLISDITEIKTCITVAVSRSVTALQLSVARDSPGAVTCRHLLSAGLSSGGQCGEASAVVVPAGAGLVASPPC